MEDGRKMLHPEEAMYLLDEVCNLWTVVTGSHTRDTFRLVKTHDLSIFLSLSLHAHIYGHRVQS